MRPLDDGAHDAVVLWAERRDGGVALECAITSGPRRGTVVNIVTSGFGARDPIELVGIACTLVVHGDEIRLAR